jgi:hypothetical protein
MELDKDTQTEVVKQASQIFNKWPTLTVAVGTLAILGYMIYEHFQFLATLTCSP